MASAKNQEILGDAEFNRKWDAEAQYQFLRKSNDPRFGEISLYKNKSTNDLVFAKEKLVTSKQQASNDIRDLKSRMALNHPNLHRLIGYSTAIQKELCSTNYLTRAYYEFPKSDLQKEINDKRANNSQFSGSELVNVAQQSVSGLNHLHKLDISHGDVRPLNLGFNKDTREVQILDRLQDPSPLEKLQGNNIINKKDLYIAPEVYRKLQGKDKLLKYSAQKNDLYGLGLSLLAAGNLEGVQNIYKPNGELDKDALSAHLNKFDGRYAASNPELSNLVHQLLAADEAQRPTSSELAVAFQSGQFSGNAGHRVQSAPADQPSLFGDFGTTTTTTQVTTYAAPPVETTTTNYVHAAPVVIESQQFEDKKTVLYNADEQPKETVYTNQTYTYSNLAPATTHYVSSAPTQTYYSQPQTTYVSSAPTYVSSAPTYVSSTPTYVSSTPTTYVSSAPTYISSSPTTYTTYASAPTETIVQAPVSGTTSETSVKYTGPTTGSTTVTVRRMDGTTYSYTLSGDEPSDQIMNTYEHHDPRNQGANGEIKKTKNSYTTYATPIEGTTTYINAPQTVTYSSPPIQTYTTSDSTPVYTTTKVYSTPTEAVSYTNYKSGSFVVQGAPVTYSSPVSYTYSSPQEVNYGGAIEVRRGSSVPTPVQDQAIKKKYIIEGDKVIEVNDDTPSN